MEETETVLTCMLSTVLPVLVLVVTLLMFVLTVELHRCCESAGKIVTESNRVGKHE